MITDLYDTTLDTLLINHAPLSLVAPPHPPHSQSEKKCILRQILSVLSYLHSLHLVHRSLLSLSLPQRPQARQSSLSSRRRRALRLGIRHPRGTLRPPAHARLPLARTAAVGSQES